MGYIEKHLMQNEKIIYTTKVSWTTYLKSILILLVGMYIQYPFYIQHPFGIFLILVGIISLVFTFMSAKFSEFAVTNKRVLIKTGLIKTHSLETMLDKVEGIFVKQGIIGKMFNSGTIVVIGTGGTNNPFKNIDAPYEFRNAVNEEVENKK